jgi:hypothetical protein
MSILTSRTTPSFFPRLGDARLQVVAPGTPTGLPQTFSWVVANARRYEEMIDRIQRFRGRVYRDDGAIPPSDLVDGECHRSERDRRSWHLVVTRGEQDILACLRYTHLADRPIPPDGLHLMRMVDRAEPATARRLRTAVRAFLDQANRRGLGVSEIGGWAAGPEARNGVKGLLLVGGCCFLAEWLGDSFGVAAATTRHHSADILRRVGGFGLDGDGTEAGFFDAYHGCEMRIMGFNLRRWAPSYQATVDDITRHLRSAPVLVP